MEHRLHKVQVALENLFHLSRFHARFPKKTTEDAGKIEFTGLILYLSLLQSAIHNPCYYKTWRSMQ
mgnify:CR=1 FL=1|jgi:hypothetical protein